MRGFDLVICGAGIVGSAAAYQAVKLGARVAVIDPWLPGRATAAGAGIISPVGLDRGETRPDWLTVVSDCVGHYHGLVAEVEAVAPSPTARPPSARSASWWWRPTTRASSATSTSCGGDWPRPRVGRGTG